MAKEAIKKQFDKKKKEPIRIEGWRQHMARS